MSTKPSGGSGAMLSRAGAGGTDTPKTPVSAEMSLISEKESLLMSAGQAFVPQWARAFVPARSSTAEVKPSQSGSLAGTVQSGRPWLAFGQKGQLSETSGRPSASASQALPMQTESDAIVLCSPPKLTYLPVQA